MDEIVVVAGANPLRPDGPGRRCPDGNGDGRVTALRPRGTRPAGEAAVVCLAEGRNLPDAVRRVLGGLSRDAGS